MAEEIEKKNLQDEIATTGNDIDIFSGYLGVLPNRDATLLSKGGGKGLKLYDEVARDPHAGSVLQTRALAVTGKEWEIEPADDSPRAQEVADFVKDTLLACNFDQARQEMLGGVLYGFYPAEVMWKVSTEGKWVIDLIRAKHPRRFVFDMERRLRLLTPGNMVDGELVPDRKFIAFTYGSSDDPYGFGLGQSLWWPVWFKKNGIKFWLTFLDKFGMPTAVGKYPNGTPKAKQDDLLDAIKAIQQETGVTIPQDMTIDLLEAARGGKVSYEAMCDYMDSAISKRVLGQTLTTQVSGEGSYAASKTHNEVRQDILKADSDLLCECLNKTLIPWLVDLNFAGAPYPKIWIRTEEEEDLVALSERDNNLKENGVRFKKPYFQEAYGIPEDQFEIQESGDGKQESGVRSQESGGGSIPLFAEASDEPDLSDILTGKMAPELDAETEAMVGKIHNLVMNAASMEEISAKVLEVAKDMPIEKFASILATGTAGAQAAGRVDIGDGKS